MHSKYRRKGRKKKAPSDLPLACFPVRQLGRAVPLPEKDVPDLDPDSEYTFANIIGINIHFTINSSVYIHEEIT